MIAADFLAAAEALPLTTLDKITRGGIVVVAPHPDDETLGCGGIIAEACKNGIDVRLVVVSDGVGSHPGSRLYPEASLRALREAETYAAMAELGLRGEAIRFLRLPDRFVPASGPEAEAARQHIMAAVNEVEATTLCVTWGRDPHCDHAATAAIVAGLANRLGDVQVWSYPIWGWTLPADTDVGSAPRGWRVDIAPHLAAKKKAIAAHRSQTSGLIQDDPSGFRLTLDMLVHFLRPFEVLLDVEAVA